MHFYPSIRLALLLGMSIANTALAQGASYRQFGTGCAGSVGVPVLDSDGDSLPVLGSTFSARLSNVPDGLSIGITGLSKTTWGAFALPMDLTGPLAMPGCTLYTDCSHANALLSVGGTATWSLALPIGSEWIGLSFFQQAIVLDLGVPGLGAVMSNACEGRLGVGIRHEALKFLANGDGTVDRLGTSIAIDNGFVAIAAKGDDDNGRNSGSVYVVDAFTGKQLSKLLSSDGASNDCFGSSIAIDNGVVAIGASLDDDNGSSSGSAYLFDLAGGSQLVKLLPNDGAELDEFGTSIDIDSGVVAVGAAYDDDNGSSSGSAYLFDAATGSQLAKLLPNDGAAGNFFGCCIAIDNGVVAVGAYGNVGTGTFAGAAYLFDAVTGAQLAKLLPTDGARGAFFGDAIAISDGVVAVGAWGDRVNDTHSGSAYLFDAVTGAFLAKLTPRDGAFGDMFGRSIAIDNGVVAVGAVFDADNGIQSGSAYLFDAVTGTQLAKLLPSDGTRSDQFGASIAIANGVVAVGAPTDNDNGFAAGSAYVF